IHPDGTDGIDPELGEVELPPWPPTSLFDLRFLLEGTEGVNLDIRDDGETERIHKIKWQPGSGGYPIVLRWDSASLPPADLRMTDGYGGAFIPLFSMFETDSLVIPEAWSFIKRVDIHVVPGTYPFMPPEIMPALPDMQVFDGQQFAEIVLDEHVEDLDTPFDQLEWFFCPGGPPWLSVDGDRILTISYPFGLTGSWEILARVEDPQGLYDEQEFRLTISEPGLPSWSVGIDVENGATVCQTLEFGIHPDATEGMDEQLGEIALPPWPPSGVFEARFLLPDDTTHVKRDMRASSSGPIEYSLLYQSGDGGFPITMRWTGTLPAGQFTIQDGLGGTYIPAVDMASVDSLQVPVELEFVTSLLMTVFPEVDMTPPLGPTNLQIIEATGNLVELEWDVAVEDHFAYYEIWFDSTGVFDPDEVLVWDWSEDGALLDIATTQTTLILPDVSRPYQARIRAWDTFGNAGLFSDDVFIPTGVNDPPWPDQSGPRIMGVSPNPFTDSAHVLMALPHSMTGVLRIHDVRGRLVSTQRVKGDADNYARAAWLGKDLAGRNCSAGVYFLILNTPGGGDSQKVLYLK
ncbi:MAG: T9SS type A sorting domain-containing protein, partial [Armatimonadetes bacterium]|nr:T9SS type A sorting domain-containing protein [Armatimonadota bacterium]